jgi:hypothetical protein
MAFLSVMGSFGQEARNKFVMQPAKKWTMLEPLMSIGNPI